MTSSTSQISLPSLLQSLTAPGGPGASTLSTSVYSMKPATLKSNQHFFFPCLTNRVKNVVDVVRYFVMVMNKQLLIFQVIQRETGIHKMVRGTLVSFKTSTIYHLRKSCICSRCPLYEFPRDLYTLQVHLITMIPPSVKQILNKEFGVHV